MFPMFKFLSDNPFWVELTKDTVTIYGSVSGEVPHSVRYLCHFLKEIRKSYHGYTCPLEDPNVMASVTFC